MTTLAQQLSLPMTVQVRRPLMDVAAARLFLDQDEDYVLSAIDSGLLPWAWDLRGLNAGRSEIRLWAPCVIELAKALRENAIPKPDERPHSLVFSSLWKHTRPVLMSTEVFRVWNCGSSHVHNLIGAKLLTPTRTDCKCTNAVPLSRESVEKFMEERKL